MRNWSFEVFLQRNTKRLIILGVLTSWLMFAFGPGAIAGSIGAFIAAAPMLGVQLVFAMFFMIMQFGALMYFMSRPRKYTVTPDDPKMNLSFGDYRGQPDLLEHARSTVRILKGAQEFEDRGGDMPKGMLLSGAPGTGKTFLASVIAAEAGLPFVYVDASSLRGMFWGMDTMMIIKLFRDARGMARKYAAKGQRGACILFIDELDSIGGARGGSTAQGVGGMMMGGGGSGLNTMLNQMDGAGAHVEDRWFQKLLRSFAILQGPLTPKPVVFVIGATNRPESLDTALIRPGRLDRLIKVYEPDGSGRRDIIAHYLAKVRHEDEMDLDLMTSDSVGWTPIAIKTTINEALIVAHDAGREALTYKDWLRAADQRSLGLKQPIANMHAEDVWALSVHEAGHAVIAHYAKPKNRILKATIIRSGDALGAVSWSPREERYTTSDADILTDIMVSLGSRAAEELVLGAKLTGASSDLQAATSRAQVYVARLGMGSTLLVTDRPEMTAKLSSHLLDDLMAQTKAMLVERADIHLAVAQALRDHHELIGEELDAVFDAAEAAFGTPPEFELKLPVLPEAFTSDQGSVTEPTGLPPTVTA